MHHYLVQVLPLIIERRHSGYSLEMAVEIRHVIEATIRTDLFGWRLIFDQGATGMADPDLD